MKSSLFLLGLALGLAPAAGAQVTSLDSAVPSRPDSQKRGRAFSLTVPGLMDALYGAHNHIETEPLDVARLIEEDKTSSSSPLRTGAVQRFAPVTCNEGQWTALHDGTRGWLWTASFKASGARSVRLRFSSFEPPLGARLVVFDAADPEQSWGPYTAADAHGDTFWTPPVYAEVVRVELFLPPPFEPEEIGDRITIDALTNHYRGPFGDTGIATSGGQEGAGACHLDVTCYPQWDETAAGVGALGYASQNWSFTCSGGMLNRVGQDFTPLFMAAAHCNVTNSDPQSVYVTWFYQTQACNGQPPSPNGLHHTRVEALLVDDDGVPNDPTSDTCLYGLRNDIPQGVTYLGWNSGYMNNGTPVVGIHHPGGDFKRITFGVKEDDLLCGAADANTYAIRIPPGDGELQPGSSGSPLFDLQGRVRGTASCASSTCQPYDEAGFYGRFDLAFPLLHPYLSPVDPIYVQNHGSGTENGTEWLPFNRVIEGAFAVQSGSTVYIAPGNYDAGITLDKPMTLRANGVGNAVIGM